jgi:MFS family permease
MFYSLRRVFARFEKPVWVIAILNVIAAMGFSISIPFLSLYLHQERDLSMTLVGLVILIGGLLSAFVHVGGGELSDKFGRRPLLLVSVCVRILMFASLAILIAFESPIWAISIAYIIGLSISTLARPILSAMITDLVPKRKLIETYAFVRVALNVGWAIGPALGGYLAVILPYAWLFAFGAAINVFSLIIIFRWLGESKPKVSTGEQFPSILSIRNDHLFLIFTGLGFLLFLVAGQLMSTLSVFTVDRIGFSTAQYGLLLTLNGLIVILFQYPLARKIGQYSKYRALIAGSLLYGIGYLLFGWVGGFSLAIIAMLILTVGEIITAPVALSVVGELAPARHRGRYMGVFELSTTVGFTFGPLLGGVVLDIFSTNHIAIWGLISSLAFVSALGYLWLGLRRKIH